MISKIYFCLLFVFITKSTNGIKCYYCTSSNSIYNEFCQNGTMNALPSGDCPFGVTSCFTEYAEDADGNLNIVRDCGPKDGLAPWNYPMVVTIWCYLDFCNVAYPYIATTQFSSTELMTQPSTQPSTQTNSSATGIPDTISIWILAFATILRFV